MKKVVRVCVRWGKYVAKYKQIVVDSDEGPVTRKIPVEWGTRCLEWKNVVVEVAEKRAGIREEYVQPPQPTGQLKPGSYTTYSRPQKSPKQVSPSKRRRMVEFKDICGCGRRR